AFEVERPPTMKAKLSITNDAISALPNPGIAALGLHVWLDDSNCHRSDRKVVSNPPNTKPLFPYENAVAYCRSSPGGSATPAVHVSSNILKTANVPSGANHGAEPVPQ